MYRFLLLAAGAALGANARYLIGIWAAQRWGVAFPYGTFLVNSTGSLLLGFLFALAAGKLSLSADIRLFLAVGFLGSYTTFSSYSVESLDLFQSGRIWLGLINIVGNNLVGISCAVLGFYLARLVTGP